MNVGLMFSSYFVGYILTQIIGAQLALRIGPKTVISIAILGSSLLTLSIPLASNYNYKAVVVIRCLIGIFQVKN